MKEPVFVLAATNYDLDGSVSGKKRRIDPALLRRFDNRIYVDLPNEEERKQYLELKLNQKERIKFQKILFLIWRQEQRGRVLQFFKMS